MLSSEAFLFRVSGNRSEDRRLSEGLHVKDLVPVRIKRLLDNGGGLCLFTANGRHREWVRESCTDL